MIALLLGGLAAWMVGNRVEIGRPLQIVIALAAAGAGFSYYWVRFIRSAPRLVTVNPAGVELHWRGGVERRDWEDITRAVHEEEKGLQWRFTYAGGELVVRDRGINPAGWERLSRAVRAHLDAAEIPWEATGAVAQGFTEDEPEDIHVSAIAPREEEPVVERIAAEEVAREALLSGNTGVFHLQMGRLDDIAPDDSGVYRLMSEYVLAIDRGDFLWLFFQLWDVDKDSRQGFDGALARSIAEGLESRGEPLLAATAYSWAHEAESDERMERLMAEHGLGPVAGFDRRVATRARVYFERLLRESADRGESRGPEQAELVQRLAQVEYQDGDRERAMAHAQEALSLGRETLELLLLIADIHKDRGELDRALAMLDEATDDYPDRGLALERKGLWLAELRGDRAGAIECLEAAITREHDLEHARRALRELVRASARTGAHTTVG